jgi:nucleotide-binding universal stress UspA family protein
MSPKKEDEMDSRPILICYDGSEGAQRAIDVAANVLVPRHAIVLDVGPYLTPAESYAVVSSAISGPEFEQANLSEARTRAIEGADRARAAGFEAEPRGDTAAPTWEGILDVAYEVDAAVIVMGSRGLTGVRERVEGSLSHAVAEHSGRPVLIVPPPGDRE